MIPVGAAVKLVQFWYICVIALFPALYPRIGGAERNDEQPWNVQYNDLWAIAGAIGNDVTPVSDVQPLNVES